MKRVLLLARKDFLRKWRNPVVIVGFMLMPLLFSFLFGLIFGREEEAADAAGRRSSPDDVGLLR